MAKKKILKQQLEDLEKNKLELISELQRVLEDNENMRLQAKTNIDVICKDKYFCGVILTQENLIEIIKLAFSTSDNIRIPYNLFEIEENELIKEEENGTI